MKIEKIEVNAMTQVVYWEHKLEALDYISAALSPESTDLYPAVAIQKLYAVLYKKLSRAYQNLFMWGTLSKNLEFKLQVSQIVLQEFLSISKKLKRELMCFTTKDGELPLAGWLSSEEEELRKELTALEKKVTLQLAKKKPRDKKRKLLYANSIAQPK